ncbi:MAG: HAMP domain-containing histidine kinase [Magnetococcales bacterium]|nr:HAMP domain-containing histidine kinase [Magnetococcales bacterium]
MSGTGSGLRGLGERLWRRTTLTTKALLVSVSMGGTFWFLADWWQTVQITQIFRQEQLKGLEIQAQHDRILFDGYIRKQEQSVRLISFLTVFSEWVEAAQNRWTIPPGDTTRWVAEMRPEWLPPQSVMRGLVAAPHILLLDKQKRLREIYEQEEGTPSLSREILETLLPRMLASDESTHILADSKGTTYLINASGVNGQRPTIGSKAFLVFVVALDNDFLTMFQTRPNLNSIVALINGDSNQVFASSQPERVQVGWSLEQLQKDYELFGKRFLDYNFSIDVPVYFATLVPKDDINRISSSIVASERRQRAMSYGALAAVFFSLVLLMTRRLLHFAEGMIDAAVTELQLPRQDVVSGDQLMIMGERFQWMIREIVQSRSREAERQDELQASNEALQRTLTMVKETQAQLVESEKMASLGNLVAGIAHEINTPVGSGVTAASYLRQESQRCAAQFASGTLRKSDLDHYFQDVVDSTQMILQNLNRAAELVRSFKQVAVDRSHEQQRLFNLHECIQQTLVSLRPHLKKTHHTVTVRCPEVLEVNSFPGAFSQILSNFIINSLMHGFRDIADGEIIVQAEIQEEDILFRYSDNGHGMEEQDRQRIFEPFFTTARGRGGSGLGMHIVYNLVTQTLQGTIQCTSSPGRGTLHEIRFPSGLELYP